MMRRFVLIAGLAAIICVGCYLGILRSRQTTGNPADSPSAAAAAVAPGGTSSSNSSALSPGLSNGTPAESRPPLRYWNSIHCRKFETSASRTFFRLRFAGWVVAWQGDG